MKRRELLGSLFSDKERREDIIIRPPYYKDIYSFDKHCHECNGICSTVCQENIIVITENKTPILNFSKSGCTYCDECAKACPSDVLNTEYKQKIALEFEIDMLQCLSWNNTLCFSCKEPCLDNAIEFLGMFRPSIIDDKCTACGFCVSRCPTNAINYKKERDQ
ncbi:ferredoxin-type protein NapF [Candidatus Marinarcus aquaticus]|uniref:Ferredoxin n=1 Tax=Candidatus Marinarcus aquaticus TaxID=2044504 RepID=A0A4Q0XRC9_9BACT|nr:ferredoxin-type protein NapF [Candidatus Marinarcus aquaticus]RXJ57617.1 ferredoxin [Candidatus Marinarcus aquaticus]